MGSPDRGVRNKALDDMLAVMFEGQEPGFDPEYGGVVAGFLARHPEQADRVKLGFINLLKADNVRGQHLPPGVGAEDNSEHYAEAIDIVSSLNDVRAIPALIGAIDTGSMATGGLIKYGEKALGPVLGAMSDPDPLVRASALTTSITILKLKGHEASRSQILGLIRTAINDPHFILRKNALREIEALAAADQAQFVPALRNMAQNDPFITPGGSVYGLRVSATRLIEKITTHGQ